VSPPPWYRDIAGGVLTAAGGIGLGAGGVLMWQATSQRDELARAESYQEYLGKLEQARHRQRLGIAIAGAGAGFLVAGAARYVLVARRRLHPADRMAGVQPHVVIGPEAILLALSWPL
jgi:hypothetical protein